MGRRLELRNLEHCLEILTGNKGDSRKLLYTYVKLLGTHKYVRITASNVELISSINGDYSHILEAETVIWLCLCN